MIGKVYREVMPKEKWRKCIRCKKKKVWGRRFCSACKTSIRHNRFEYS